MHPLIKQLQERLPAGTQTHFRSIITDDFLCVKGSSGSIYAIGDAATIEQQKVRRPFCCSSGRAAVWAPGAQQELQSRGAGGDSYIPRSPHP